MEQPSCGGESESVNESELVNDAGSGSFDSYLDPPQVSISSHDSPENQSLYTTDEQVQTCSFNGLDNMLLHGGGKNSIIKVSISEIKRIEQFLPIPAKLKHCHFI